MKKKQSYQFVKTSKVGSVSSENVISTIVYEGERFELVERGTVADMYSEALVTYEYHVAGILDMLGIDTPANFDGSKAVGVYDVLPKYTPAENDEYIANAHVRETIDGNTAYGIEGRFYRRAKNGNIRYTGVVFTVVTFGHRETYIFRCNGAGIVTPRSHTLQSLYRLIERPLASAAYETAEDMHTIEKKRVSVAYVLRPIYDGSANVVS